MKRVLIVEDDRYLTRLVSQLFHQRGYEVDAADSYSCGLTLAQPEAYSLYLLDVNLPDGTGIHLCNHIRNMGETVPIIVYSADESNEALAMVAGANAFLAKSASLDDRLEEVLDHIEKLASRAKRVA